MYYFNLLAFPDRLIQRTSKVVKKRLEMATLQELDYTVEHHGQSHPGFRHSNTEDGTEFGQGEEQMSNGSRDNLSFTAEKSKRSSLMAIRKYSARRKQSLMLEREGSKPMSRDGEAQTGDDLVDKTHEVFPPVEDFVS